MKSHERFLTDIISIVARSKHAEHGPRDRRLMSFHQAPEGVVVATAGASDQCGIIVAICHVGGGERSSPIDRERAAAPMRQRVPSALP